MSRGLERQPLGRVLLVTCRRLAEEAGLDLLTATERALAALPPGGAVVQLREKDLPARDLHALVKRLLRVTRPRRCPLLVNDRLDVAVVAGADGVHLPERGLPIAAARALAPTKSFLIGVSTHGPDGAGAAAHDGADLIACGPVWDTPSKRELGAPIGLEALSAAAGAVRRSGTGARLFALGGVDAGRVAAARAAGAHGIGAIRAWLTADPAAAAAALADAATAP